MQEFSIGQLAAIGAAAQIVLNHDEFIVDENDPGVADLKEALVIIKSNINEHKGETAWTTNNRT